MPDERIFAELAFGHKVEQRPKRETNDRNIRPVLVFGENDHRAPIWQRPPLLDLQMIKDEKTTSRLCD
jgi:hypothetical protein